jgi:hypothetical protein
MFLGFSTAPQTAASTDSDSNYAESFLADAEGLL